MHRLLRTRAAPATYRPLSEYGAIGQGHSVALVSRDGSLDWWSPGRFDAPSVFAAILDGRVGGRYRVAPVEAAVSEQRYVDGTNVLETVHRTATGAVRVVDFAPFHDDTGIGSDAIVRRVTGLSGDAEVEIEFSPAFHYGRVAPRLSRTPAGTLARGAGEIMLLRGPDLAIEGASARGRVPVREGETIDLVLRHRPFDTPVPFANPLARSPAELEARTVERWRAWSAKTRACGRYTEPVRRAALALKLLQSARSGAIVAAATTSLPEEVGGVRNWDYRYAWIRDAALSARALADLGHDGDADALASWIARTVKRDGEDVRIMYSMSGSADLAERELRHLEGYRRSAPVRIGNAAATQRQLDVYGEMLDYLASRPRAWTGDEWAPMRRVVEWVRAHWTEPDSGIWEMRCEPRHFVLSKAMASVALLRAADIAERDGLAGDVEAWRAEAGRIREDVLANGWDGKTGAFVQAYGHPHLDASNLLLPLMGFLDAGDPRVRATVDRTMERLMANGLVYRYIEGGDGVAGGEATFAYCTFWLVEVLALQGRVDEARAIFEGILSRATPLGLFAEEIDAATGEHLGNFPQGFPHAGLITAALALERASSG